MATTSDATDETLFDHRPVATFDLKVSAFAREVAKRHSGHSDVGRLVSALRGYYAMWALFERLPALDDRAIARAVAAYHAAHGRGNPVAA